MGKKFVVIQKDRTWEYDCKNCALLKAQMLMKMSASVEVLDRMSGFVIFSTKASQFDNESISADLIN